MAAEQKKADMVAILKGAEAKVLKKTKAGQSSAMARAKIQGQISAGNTTLSKTTTTESDPIARMKLMSNLTDKKLTKLQRSPAPKEKVISDRTQLLGQIKKKDVQLEDASEELARAEQTTVWATKAAFKAAKKEEVKE
mmetsp:Transcript_17625/g.43020  ORF Transcript_17625/g.43020 Transcript_17625/m.43020 type:complete len:138 (-) Transcript_17625:143-556(-)